MNHGIDIKREEQEVQDTDWVFGAGSAKCMADIPENVREQYLPIGELQAGREDFMDCASRSVLNILETKLNWLIANGLTKHKDWLIKNGYQNGLSDRYISILSGTTKSGNSLKSPLEAVRKHGVIPKPMFPASSDMTFDQYHSGITDKMTKTGQEFLKKFTVNYERVNEEDYKELLGQDMLDVAGFAWPAIVDGEYPRVNYTPNHAFMIFKRPMAYVFDNYPETASDPNRWIKKLSANYDYYSHGYRIYLTENIVEEQINLIQQIINKMRQVVGLLLQVIEIKKNTPEPEPEPIPEPTPEPLKYDWSSKEKSRYSCRVIMDEYNLRWTQKDILCAVIEAESNFNIKAVNDNGNSKDWGICQINDYWHVGEGKEFRSVEEILEFPEKSVHFMIRMYLAGQLNLWTAYKNKSYQRYL